MTGILLALIAGILNGSFATPTKYTTRWKWENIWALWAFTAFFVVPWIIALATVPHLFTAYADAGAQPITLLIVFGAGYGIAAACFGLGVDALGIALNFAIALGISIAIGSLLLVLLFSLIGLFPFSKPKQQLPNAYNRISFSIFSSRLEVVHIEQDEQMLEPFWTEFRADIAM